MNPQTEFRNLLRQYNFTLVRQNKHYVYTDGRGRVLVVAKTPSDHFAYNSMIRDLKAVVSNPPPSSLTIEEERQRRELEKNIVLWAERKKNISAKRCNGNGGGHGHAKSGSGFYYDQAKEVAFVPEEVKAEARLNKEWDNMLYHCKKQVRRVEGDLERIFYVVHPMCVGKMARQTVKALTKQMRAGEIHRMNESLKTRQEREGLSLFIAKHLATGKCVDPGALALEVVLGSVITDGKVHLDVEYSNCHVELDPAIKNQINDVLWDALYLTSLIWAHDDGHKPKWFEPMAAEMRKDRLYDQGRRFINRAQRLVRNKVITDRFTVEIVEAMGRIPK